jgi:hypothetical protein
MNASEYHHEIGNAKRARSARINDATDPAAHAAFERDFSEPVDDARVHEPCREDELEEVRFRQRQLFVNRERKAA